MAITKAHPLPDWAVAMLRGEYVLHWLIVMYHDDMSDTVVSSFNPPISVCTASKGIEAGLQGQCGSYY